MNTTKSAGLNSNNSVDRPYIDKSLSYREYLCPVCKRFRTFSIKENNYFCNTCKILLAELPKASSKNA